MLQGQRLDEYLLCAVVDVAYTVNTRYLTPSGHRSPAQCDAQEDASDDEGVGAEGASAVSRLTIGSSANDDEWGTARVDPRMVF